MKATLAAPTEATKTVSQSKEIARIVMASDVAPSRGNSLRKTNVTPNFRSFLPLVWFQQTR